MTTVAFPRVAIATYAPLPPLGELGFPKEAPHVHDLKAYRNIARKFGKQSAAEKSGGALDVRKDAAGRAGMAGQIDSRILALMNAGLLSSDEENAALGANEDVRWNPLGTQLGTQLCTLGPVYTVCGCVFMYVSMYVCGCVFMYVYM